MYPVVAQLRHDGLGRRDAPQRFAGAAPRLGDPLEGRPVGQAMQQAAIKLAAVDALAHALADRREPRRRRRAAWGQRYGAGDDDRSGGAGQGVAGMQVKAAVLAGQADFDRRLAARRHQQRTADFEMLDLDAIDRVVP